jgi:hypothetical protein
MTAMKINGKKPMRGLSLLVVIFAGFFGCGGTHGGGGLLDKGHTGGMQKTRSGVELWTQQCGRCHNLRSPDEFSYAQWEVAVNHMRVRATLTAEDAREILDFFKAAAPGITAVPK